MGFVGEPFAHDLFVSYSHGAKHGDDQPLHKQYATAFFARLKRELEALPGLEGLDLVFDNSDRLAEQLESLQHLTPQIEARVRASARLLAFITHPYMQSKWCRFEREIWLDQRQQADDGVPAEVMIARLQNMVGAEWPADLCDHAGEPPVGVKFHGPDPDKPQPHGWPDLRNRPAEFDEAMIALSARLRRELIRTKELVAQAAKRRAFLELMTKETGQLLYLHARQSETQEPLFRATQAQLTDHDFVVTPDDPDPIQLPPAERHDFENSRVQILRTSHALLLLTQEQGRYVDEDMVVVGFHNRKLASAEREEPLPCAILDPIGGAIATDTRRERARRLGIHWIDATGGDRWPLEVREWLQAVAGEAA